MRKADRQITDKARITSILEKSRVIHLGLNDSDGYPYVIPLSYGFEFVDDKLILYMHSAKAGHKIDLIKANSKCAFAIDCDVELYSGDIACKYGTYYKSIMGKGEIKILENVEEKIKGIKVLMKTQTNKDFDINDKMANSINVMKLDVVSYTAKSNEKKEN